MKKSFLILSSLLSISIFGQMKFPTASPEAEVEQTIGIVKMQIDYLRPAKKGRTIFGGLVPYGEIWRTGANENTTIEFSDDIKIDNTTLEKGKYAIYTKPEKNQWTIYFYKDTKNWGLPKAWNDNLVALKTTVKSQKLSPSSEFFTIEINPLSNNDGEIVMKWDTTQIQIPFQTFSHQRLMAYINNDLSQSTNAGDYFQAGSYLLRIGENPKKALELTEKAIQLIDNPPAYMLKQKEQAEAQLKNVKK